MSFEKKGSARPMLRPVLAFRAVLAFAGAMLLSDCCSGSGSTPNCRSTAQSSACTQINRAVQSKCGPSAQLSCAALFGGCGLYPNVCGSDVSACVAQINSTFTCDQARATDCSFSCSN